MSAVYKYLAGLGVIALIVIGAFLYGVHTGKLAGTAKVNALMAAEAQAMVTATKAAAQAQSQADAATQVQLQAAVTAANQAVADARARQLALATTVSTLTARIKANEENPTVAAWSGVSIPAGALAGLQFCAGVSATPNSASHTNPVPADTGC
ncbi:MAG: hypothetical protein WBR15_02720 [Gammaproteobacteria bacterium]